LVSERKKREGKFRSVGDWRKEKNKPEPPLLLPLASPFSELRRSRRGGAFACLAGLLLRPHPLHANKSRLLSSLTDARRQVSPPLERRDQGGK
jgi:hypothetical protein